MYIRTNDKGTVLINNSKTYVVHLIQVCGGVGMIYLLRADGTDGLTFIAITSASQRSIAAEQVSPRMVMV